MYSKEVQAKLKVLKNNIEKSNSVSEKINAFIKLRDFLYYINPSESLKITNEAIIYANNNKAIDDYYRLISLKANIYVLINKTEDAIPIYFDCINYFEAKDNKEQLSLVYGNLANLLYRLGVFNVAIYLFNYSLHNLVSPAEKKKIAIFYVNLMNIYFYNLKILKFDEHFILSIEQTIIELKENNSPLHLYIKRNLARYYRLCNRFVDSKKVYNEILAISKEMNFFEIEHEVHFELGIINIKLGNFEESLNHFINAEKIALSNNMFNLLHEIYEQIYHLYKNENLFDKALYYYELNKDYEEKHRLIVENNLVLIQQLGYNYIINEKTPIMEKYFLSFNQQRYIFEKNIKGEVVKINIDEIVYLVKDISVLKIIFVNGKVLHLKINYKDIITKINNLSNGNLMFFEANLRGLMVNLYWLLKIDYIKKELTLKALIKEYKIFISKRQIPLLKKRIDLI